MKLATLLNIIS